ncbi:NADPH-dependent 2,4-dienoyl-CoA reductase [Brachybacterium sp. JHP9]|uniref:NADPH-dependent 2,4-dienoyl-CoA reductase n=1 Tax=Brachybacterium equifaecis TaxID=2910770 RepID=A0ABT0QYI9_9MICO|nr:NADPH-dependent 2,4-dienoyl-CoA reductase [Brachybacterium equifaecis]MCL6422630.1 NADPH-dependent 2,4-dienoyl-CoA reductase [Brachybacterium equifaecis]
MPTMTPHLLSPLDLGPFTVRNRIVMGSMHVGLEDRAADAPALAAFLGERARGGPGLIVTGGFSPNRTGRLTPHGAQFTRAVAAAHRGITDAVHEAEGRVVLQLLHAGRYAFHPLAASADAGRSPITPFRARRLTRLGAQRTIGDFARAARRAREAGYDGVEIMGSEGYLLNQFLAPVTNHRRDRFGGSAAARQALPLAVARAVREAVGPKALLSYRISLADLVPGGQEQEETLALGRALERAGVDVLSTGIGWHEARVPTIVASVPEGVFVPLTAALRAEVGIPVVASNRLHDPQLAEGILERGEADLISMARPLLADPQLPAKLAAGRARETVACISCNQACLDRVFDGKRASCLVNPRAGRETELVLRPVPPQRRRAVAVVGAGPAGCEAAITAAERGHRVTLFEQAEAIGGQFLFASRIPGKEVYARALDSWSARLEASGVDLRLGAKPSAEELSAFADVILATGVRPRELDLPVSAEVSPRVLSYAQLLSLPRERAIAEVGERVAIIGAGGIGVDVAEFLTAPDPSLTLDPPAWRARWGLAPGADGAPTTPGPREVHLLQRKPGKIGAGLGRTTGWVHRAELRHAGVIEHRGVAYLGLEPGGLRIREDGAERLLAVDTVIVCAGQESVRDLAGLEGARVHVIGGADVAAELDAVRAISQAVEVAAAL